MRFHWLLCLAIISICVLEVISQSKTNESEGERKVEESDPNDECPSPDGFWCFFSYYYERKFERTLWMACFYLLVASLIKVGYHQSPFLTNNIPESCVLIMIGLAFGTFFEIFNTKIEFPAFTIHLFFFGLLPPIILEAAHTLHDDVFFGNLLTILMYAVVGTLINVFLIGISLYLFSVFKFNFLDFPSVPLIELLIFSNAISAVDPVTVLTIFQDLKVNKPLYYLVFGESLLNDAVVIALHGLLTAFIKTPLISSLDVMKGMATFFAMSIGGLCIGVVFGLLTAVMTLYTKHSEVIEPMLIIGTAYLSYVSADIMGTSGLISLVGCGIVQLEFAHRNVTAKTYTTVKYFIKTLSSVADLMIFFFLGQSLINMYPTWNTSFVTLTIIFCLLYRCVSVFSLSYISNTYFHRTRNINLEEQTLMAYGGLRGAVAFAMIVLLEEVNGIQNGPLFKTTTLIVILFTVFILGGTTKPLLNFLQIQKESTEGKKISNIINYMVMHTVLNGIEDIMGNISATNYLRNILKDVIKWLKKYITKPDADTKIEADIKKFDRLIDKKEAHELGDKKVTSIEHKTILIVKQVEKILQIVSKDTKDDKKVDQKVVKNTFTLTRLGRNRCVSNKLNLKLLKVKDTFAKPSDQ